MIYTFTENDIASLGVTDERVKSILLKTSIVDSGYNGGLEMYVASRKSQFHVLGGVDVRYNTGYSTLISLQKENNRTRITFYDDIWSIKPFPLCPKVCLYRQTLHVVVPHLLVVLQ